MEESHLIESLAGEAAIAKQEAEAAAGAVFAFIGDTLLRGMEVAVSGLGWFGRTGTRAPANVSLSGRRPESLSTPARSL